ncbi:hypothetical protein C8R44DRAFT_762699 [Mycena epipterygia]|nr:hypothetical protein C8R44DRAFT_762699 [Mycena epipterygia]
MFPSSFAPNLGSNYCPQDEEVAEIKTLLIQPCVRLKCLDDEIAAMQKAIDKLTEERNRLGAYVEAHKALISPIRRLPLDILQEIFMACIPTHRNCVMSASEAPVILGRICSSWRTISLAAPRLWSRLHVVEPRHPYNSTPGLFEAKVAQRLKTTKAWLGRSGNCPLSISLDSPQDDGMSPITPSFVQKIDPFLHALLPFASRWRDIRLVVPPSALEALGSLGENDVPLLQHFEIVSRPEYTYQSASARWSLPSLLRGPNLSNFSITGMDMNPTDLPLRWNQLTFLSIMGPAWGVGHTQTSEAILWVLSKCPELRTCRVLVHDDQVDLAVDPPESIIECSFLHTFDLICVGAPLCTSNRVLNRLSFPDLRQFKLRGHAGPPGDPHGITSEPLASFLAASTRLERIDIESGMFAKSSLLHILRRLPSTIRCLQITDLAHSWHTSMAAEGALDDDVLTGFIPSSHLHTPYCPVLQELVITRCRMISDQALLGFINCRMSDQSFSPLTRVEVQFDREKQVDILPSLQPFMETGLQALITHISPAPPQFSPWQGLADAPPDSHGWTYSQPSEVYF